MDFTPYYTDRVSWGYVEKVAPFRRSNDLLPLGEISSIHIIPDNLHTFVTSSLAYHICLTELGARWRMTVLYKQMDAAAELGRNPVSKHQIQLEY